MSCKRNNNAKNVAVCSALLLLGFPLLPALPEGGLLRRRGQAEEGGGGGVRTTRRREGKKIIFFLPISHIFKAKFKKKHRKEKKAILFDI